VSVRLTPNSAQTLDQGKAILISAAVSNSPKQLGVSWTLIGGGALVAQTTTSVVYQAPATISEGASVAVTATSIADGKKTATPTIILVPAKRAPTASTNIRKQRGQGVRG
jgi:hypothetical protein